MHQDDYIIRIYRRNGQNSQMVVGTLEKVGEKLKMSFTDFEELRAIMNVPRGRPSQWKDPMDHDSLKAVSSEGG